MNSSTGHLICFVFGHLKYDKYVCVPGAARLFQLVRALCKRIQAKYLRKNDNFDLVKGYNKTKKGGIL